MAGKKPSSPRQKEIRNSRIHRDYFVEDSYEAGIVLTGTEVKSIRTGNAQISESFARFERGKLILYNAYIDEYTFGNYNNHAPRRPRKLLLHKKELIRLKQAVEAERLTLVPRRLYFKQALVKVDLCLCKGKKQYDRRDDLKAKVTKREIDRAMKFSI